MSDIRLDLKFTYTCPNCGNDNIIDARQGPIIEMEMEDPEDPLGLKGDDYAMGLGTIEPILKDGKTFCAFCEVQHKVIPEGYDSDFLKEAGIE